MRLAARPPRPRLGLAGLGVAPCAYAQRSLLVRERRRNVRVVGHVGDGLSALRANSKRTCSNRNASGAGRIFSARPVLVDVHQVPNRTTVYEWFVTDVALASSVGTLSVTSFTMGEAPAVERYGNAAPPLLPSQITARPVIT